MTLQEHADLQNLVFHCKRRSFSAEPASSSAKTHQGCIYSGTACKQLTWQSGLSVLCLPAGRFTNGPLFPEYMAAHLNLTLLDFGAAGATSGAVNSTFTLITHDRNNTNGTRAISLPAPSLPQQVNLVHVCTTCAPLRSMRLTLGMTCHGTCKCVAMIAACAAKKVGSFILDSSQAPVGRHTQEG